MEYHRYDLYRPSFYRTLIRNHTQSIELEWYHFYISTLYVHLEWPLTQISRARHFLKSNIGKTARLKDNCTRGKIPNIWNGTMFGDLDWPLSASRGFVSISWASCLLLAFRFNLSSSFWASTSFSILWVFFPALKLASSRLQTVSHVSSLLPIFSFTQLWTATALCPHNPLLN